VSTSTTAALDVKESFTGSVSATVFFNAQRESAVATKKVVRKNRFVKIDLSTNVGGVAGPWNLGVADVFNIKDGWVFQEAMSAATQAISQNIASIRSNLEFVDPNNNVTVGGTPSQQELNDFVKRVEDRNLTKLNVHMIGSANYELKDNEIIDKGFTLLN
jgi:hypothetical protein